MMNSLLRILLLCFIFLLSSCSTQAPFLKYAQPCYVPIKNGWVEYYHFGHGSPIVLIPGYLTDVTSWNASFLAKLAQQHELFIFNLRNVGGSSCSPSHFAPQNDLVNDTHEFIQQLHLHRPAVLGLSMGGMIAQQLAVTYPDCVGSLILVNTAIAGSQSIRPSPIVEKQVLSLTTNKIERFLLALQLYFPPSQRNKAACSLLCDRFEPTHCNEINPRKVIDNQQLFLLTWSKNNAIADRLKTLNIPTLILVGDSDYVIPPQNSVILRKTMPNSRLISWPQAGHALLFQYPYPIADAINCYLGCGQR